MWKWWWNAKEGLEISTTVPRLHVQLPPKTDMQPTRWAFRFATLLISLLNSSMFFERLYSLYSLRGCNCYANVGTWKGWPWWTPQLFSPLPARCSQQLAETKPSRRRCCHLPSPRITNHSWRLGNHLLFQLLPRSSCSRGTAELSPAALSLPTRLGTRSRQRICSGTENKKTPRNDNQASAAQLCLREIRSQSQRQQPLFAAKAPRSIHRRLKEGLWRGCSPCCERCAARGYLSTVHQFCCPSSADVFTQKKNNLFERSAPKTARLGAGAEQSFSKEYIYT